MCCIVEPSSDKIFLTRKFKTPIIFSKKFPNLRYLVNHWTRGDWKLTVSSATGMEPAKTAHYIVKFTRTAHVFLGFFCTKFARPLSVSNVKFTQWILPAEFQMNTVVSSPNPTLLRGEMVW